MTTRQNIRSIDSNTNITFTIKTFLALIGTILGIFFGFYNMVIIPRVKSLDENNTNIQLEMVKQSIETHNEFKEINTKLYIMNNMIYEMKGENSGKNSKPTSSIINLDSIYNPEPKCTSLAFINPGLQ